MHVTRVINIKSGKLLSGFCKILINECESKKKTTQNMRTMHKMHLKQLKENRKIFISILFCLRATNWFMMMISTTLYYFDLSCFWVCTQNTSWQHANTFIYLESSAIRSLLAGLIVGAGVVCNDQKHLAKYKSNKWIFVFHIKSIFRTVETFLSVLKQWRVKTRCLGKFSRIQPFWKVINVKCRKICLWSNILETSATAKHISASLCLFDLRDYNNETIRYKTMTFTGLCHT